MAMGILFPDLLDLGYDRLLSLSAVPHYDGYPSAGFSVYKRPAMPPAAVRAGTTSSLTCSIPSARPASDSSSNDSQLTVTAPSAVASDSDGGAGDEVRWLQPGERPDHAYLDDDPPHKQRPRSDRQPMPPQCSLGRQ